MAKYEIYLPVECPECGSTDIKITDRNGIEFQCKCNHSDCEHRFNYVMML